MQVGYLLSQGIVLAPHRDEFRQVVGAQNGGIPGQIVEAVHNDSHHDVEHDKAAQKDERNKVKVGDVGAAFLVGIHRQIGRLVDLHRALVANSARDAGHHNVGPRLSGGASIKNSN